MHKKMGNWYVYSGGKVTFIGTKEKEVNKEVKVSRQVTNFTDVYNNTIEGVVHITNFKYGEFKYADDNSVYVTYNRSSGTGFYTDIKDGYIITAAHVIKPHEITLDDLNADKWITKPEDEYIITDFNVNKMIRATLVGVDYVADVAVLKLNETVTVKKRLSFRDNRNVKIGEHCLVLGNPSSHFIRSISAGIVRDNKSSDLPELPESVMTDADIISGNSGGPLVDVNGKVIGIISYVTSQNGGCVASHMAEDIVKYILENESTNVVVFDSGYLGANLFPVSSAANMKRVEFYSKITSPYHNIKIPENYSKSSGYVVSWDHVDNPVFEDNDANFPKPFDILEYVSINNDDFVAVGADNEDYPLRTIIHLAGEGANIRFKYRKASEKYGTQHKSDNIKLLSFPKDKEFLFTNHMKHVEHEIKKLN